MHNLNTLNYLKLFGVSAALICAFGIFSFAKSTPAAPPKVIELSELPKIQIAGDVLTNKDLQHSVILVDFWASWCSPCLKALPFYESLYKKYRTKGLMVIAVNLDDDFKARDKFLKEHPISLPIFADGQPKYYDLFQIQVVPTLYILNKDKQILKKYQGFGAKEQKEIESLVKKLLN